MGTVATDWTGMYLTPEYDERFRVLYETHGDDLRAYCTRRLGPDEAEDALSEVFAVVWRRLDEVPSGGEARLWLYGVGRNVVRNATRSSRRRLRLASRLIGRWDPAVSGPADALLTRSEHEEVLAALATLRPHDQELLRLHAWEELSREEIAQVLGVSIGAVDMRLHRAIRRMRSALDSRGFTDHATRRATRRGGKP